MRRTAASKAMYSDIMAQRLRKNHVPNVIAVAWLIWGLGCSGKKNELSIAEPFIQPKTLAVAPILNFSGEFQLDPIKAADLLASELTFVKGVGVLPVNRVVAVLAGQGKSHVESPAHALEVAEAVGSDAILIAGITEYDAYTPAVGLVLQIYAARANDPDAFDPVVASRRSEPFTASRLGASLVPTSQFQAVYNAAHKRTRQAVKKYATPRVDHEENHLGWRQYLKVQSLFLRFCWHDALSNLMKQERSRWILTAMENNRETPV
ncbi:MAG: hypothetical protein MI923_19560 [Phycisphaerales bacterium]|nr:hypothetical protein [Phycisphaerales bacterium]